jgi:SAM-dependent methyltransferase
MLHTFVAEDVALVRETVRVPFTSYLRCSTDLIRRAKWYFPAFTGAQDARAGAELDGASATDIDALLDHAFDRYFDTHGLFGSPESCLALVSDLQASGVDEIACLVDFGVDTDEVLGSLKHLDRLRRMCAPERGRADDSIAARVRVRHVTHMQCTPSLLRALLEDPETREALGALDQLLVGGEALPEPLAAELHGLLREGALLNMYGPTETTVWSSSAVLRRGEPITVGHPIANTSMFVLDRDQRPSPVGVVGELYIGGAGVARGYLDRPELTAERFVDSPFGGEGRLYRTGDRARWRPEGDVEILGRVDHQVKVRGHRVELAEVEAALLQHHAVHQAVVVACANDRGGHELVAHVVPEAERDGSAVRGAHWGALWEQVYGGLASGGTSPNGEGYDPGWNFAGWNSSYGGEALPAHEMREWVSDTAARILELHPQNVLEIGCGAGLLVQRVAPHVRRYVGVDPSAAALSSIEAELREHPIPQLVLVRARADELSGLPVELYDTIVINSVVQYFPDVHYLLHVLEWALDRLSYGGALFVGDVRNLELLEAFHTSIELSRAGPSTSREELHERVRRRSQREEELVVDPRLFEAFGRAHPEIANVVVTLKRGNAENELTKFRYDVLIRRRSVGSAGLLLRPRAERVVQGSSLHSAEDVRRELRASPAALRVVGLPNARLSRELRAMALLASPLGGMTVGDLRAALASGDPQPGDREMAFPPEELRTIDPGYEATLTWAEGSPGQFDALWVPRGGAGETCGHPRAARLGVSTPSAAWESYVHSPRPLGLGETLIPDLRRHLRAILPEAMVPSSFVLCDALPVDARGQGRSSDAVAGSAHRGARTRAPRRQPAGRRRRAQDRGDLGGAPRRAGGRSNRQLRRPGRELSRHHVGEREDPSRLRQRRLARGDVPLSDRRRAGRPFGRRSISHAPLPGSGRARRRPPRSTAARRHGAPPPRHTRPIQGR